MSYFSRIYWIGLAVVFAVLSIAVKAETQPSSQPTFDDWFLLTKDKKFRKPAGYVNASGEHVVVDGKPLYKLKKVQEIDTKFLLVRFDISSEEVAFYDEQGLLGAKIDFRRGDTYIEIVGKRIGGRFDVTQSTRKGDETTVKEFSKTFDDVRYTSFDGLKPLDISQWPVGTESSEKAFIFLKEELIDFSFQSEGRRFETLNGETHQVTVLQVDGPQKSEIWYDSDGRRLAGKQRLGSFYKVDQQTALNWKELQ